MITKLVAFAVPFLLTHGFGGILGSLIGNRIATVACLAILLVVAGFAADRRWDGQIPRHGTAVAVVLGILAGLGLLLFGK